MTAARDKDGKYSLDKWEAGGVATIQPKSGSAYTVRMHCNFQKHGPCVARACSPGAVWTGVASHPCILDKGKTEEPSGGRGTISSPSVSAVKCSPSISAANMSSVSAMH